MKNTIENNKLIAEFMSFENCKILNNKGKKYDFHIPNIFTLIKETETTIESNWCEILEEQDYCFIEDLLFHKSWDWLMPVVAKIQEDELYPQYVDDTTNMLESGGIKINAKFINETYEDVIDFINWYNY